MTEVVRPSDRRYGRGCRLLKGYRSDKPHWNETILARGKRPRREGREVEQVARELFDRFYAPLEGEERWVPWDEQPDERKDQWRQYAQEVLGTEGRIEE